MLTDTTWRTIIDSPTLTIAIAERREERFVPDAQEQKEAECGEGEDGK